MGQRTPHSAQARRAPPTCCWPCASYFYALVSQTNPKIPQPLQQSLGRSPDLTQGGGFAQRRPGEHKRRRTITMAHNIPHQSFGSSEARNAILGSQFSGTTYLNFHGPGEKLTTILLCVMLLYSNLYCHRRGTETPI